MDDAGFDEILEQNRVPLAVYSRDDFMNITKTRRTTNVHADPGQVKVGPRNPTADMDPRVVRVLELAIGEDFDRGNDPYNNTGQQIIIKLREDTRR